MTLSEITHAERSTWQRRAAAQLTRILDAHRDLPVIAWTVSPAGATLVGQVHASTPAVEVRQVFDTWRIALALDESRQSAGGPAVYLRAVADRHRVRLVLVATVFDDADREVAR